MERSWFDLSKSRKRQLIEHTTKDGSWVKIHSDKEYGLATIYDMDILLFITSMLMDKKNKGQQLSRRITFTGYEYFYFTNKHRSGRADKQLQEALTRLHTTRIETSIRSEHKKNLYSSFYWISDGRRLRKMVEQSVIRVYYQIGFLIALHLHDTYSHLMRNTST